MEHVLLAGRKVELAVPLCRLSPALIK